MSVQAETNSISDRARHSHSYTDQLTLTNSTKDRLHERHMEVKKHLTLSSF